MENVDVDYKILDKGIQQLLGKEDYPPAEKLPEDCKHISDGFIYDDNGVIVLLQCARCQIQYEILKATGAIL